MRVISGLAKGRYIKTIDVPNLRPTSDRVKESLFNIIAPYLTEEDIVADFFAGTGNIGIEFLSRGVKEVYFIENNKRCISLIYENLKRLNFLLKSKVINKDVLSFINKSKKEFFDIIFLDPPYESHLAKTTTENIFKNKILKFNGFVIVEHTKDIMLNSVYYTVVKQCQYGDTVLSFLKYGGI